MAASDVVDNRNQADPAVRASLSDDEKLEYVYFLLIVGRFDLDMYWKHLNLWKDSVVVHHMYRSTAPGYCSFKLTFQESVSNGHLKVVSCSAEELYEDRRFAQKFFPVFLQLRRSLKQRYGFLFFQLISILLF